MRVQYDPSANAMYIGFAEGVVADSDEVREGVVLDYDANGRCLASRFCLSVSAPTTLARWRSNCSAPEGLRELR